MANLKMNAINKALENVLTEPKVIAYIEAMDDSGYAAGQRIRTKYMGYDYENSTYVIVVIFDWTSVQNAKIYDLRVPAWIAYDPGSEVWQYKVGDPEWINSPD